MVDILHSWLIHFVSTRPLKDGVVRRKVNSSDIWRPHMESSMPPVMRGNAGHENGRLFANFEPYPTFDTVSPPLRGALERIALTTSAVKQSVADLNRIVDGISTSRVVHFPQAEANEGHLVARVQLDSGRHGE